MNIIVNLDNMTEEQLNRFYQYVDLSIKVKNAKEKLTELEDQMCSLKTKIVDDNHPKTLNELMLSENKYAWRQQASKVLNQTTSMELAKIIIDKVQPRIYHERDQEMLTNKIIKLRKTLDDLDTPEDLDEFIDFFFGHIDLLKNYLKYPD